MSVSLKRAGHATAISGQIWIPLLYGSKVKNSRAYCIILIHTLAYIGHLSWCYARLGINLAPLIAGPSDESPEWTTANALASSPRKVEHRKKLDAPDLCKLVSMLAHPSYLTLSAQPQPHDFCVSLDPRIDLATVRAQNGRLPCSYASARSQGRADPYSCAPASWRSITSQARQVHLCEISGCNSHIRSSRRASTLA